MPVEDKPRAARLVFFVVAGITCQLYLLATMCGASAERVYFVRVARVEGDPQRYSVREMDAFPPAAEVVHPTTACNGPETSVDVWREQFSSSFFYLPDHLEQGAPPDSIVLKTACTAIYGDESRDRCYRFTIDGVEPVPIVCETDQNQWSSAFLESDHTRYNGGLTPRYRGRLKEAQLELVISEDAEYTSWLGGFVGGVKGPYKSQVEVFDTRRGKRIFALTTTKGLWSLETGWFAVGRRARIVTLLSRTHTAVIDIHPGP